MSAVTSPHSGFTLASSKLSTHLLPWMMALVWDFDELIYLLSVRNLLMVERTGNTSNAAVDSYKRTSPDNVLWMGPGTRVTKRTFSVQDKVRRGCPHNCMTSGNQFFSLWQTLFWPVSWLFSLPKWLPSQDSCGQYHRKQEQWTVTFADVIRTLFTSYCVSLPSPEWQRLQPSSVSCLFLHQSGKDFNPALSPVSSFTRVTKTSTQLCLLLRSFTDCVTLMMAFTPLLTHMHPMSLLWYDPIACTLIFIICVIHYLFLVRVATLLVAGLTLTLWTPLVDSACIYQLILKHRSRGSHLHITCWSVCNWDQESWSVKIVLDASLQKPLIGWLSLLWIIHEQAWVSPT